MTPGSNDTRSRYLARRAASTSGSYRRRPREGACSLPAALQPCRACRNAALQLCRRFSPAALQPQPCSPAGAAAQQHCGPAAPAAQQPCSASLQLCSPTAWQPCSACSLACSAATKLSTYWAAPRVAAPRGLQPDDHLTYELRCEGVGRGSPKEIGSSASPYTTHVHVSARYGGESWDTSKSNLTIVKPSCTKSLRTNV